MGLFLQFPYVCIVQWLIMFTEHFIFYTIQLKKFRDVFVGTRMITGAGKRTSGRSLISGLTVVQTQSRTQLQI
jgi:hypothetical protein